MQPTTEYTNSASRDLTGSLNATDFETIISDYLGEFTEDFDIEAITEEYTTAVDDTLPDYVTLAGNFIYGPADRRDAFYDDLPAIREAIAEIDLNAIAQKHDKTR